MASQLESLGVRNLAELEAMPPNARKELEAKMVQQWQSWDWNWLDGWKSKAGIGLAGVGLAGIGAASTRAESTDSSSTLPHRPVSTSHWERKQRRCKTR